MSASTPRTALLLGAVGRLGGELLNGLVAHPGYGRVSVAVESEQLRSMTPKLQPFVAGPSGGAWLPLPTADDVFCCLGDERSYHRRDQAYRAVLESDVAHIAHSAAAGGCRRFVLVAPMAAFLQLAGTGRGFTSTAEAAAAALGFETIVFVRPTENDRKREGTWLQRAAAAWIGTLAHYLTPQQLQPVTSKTVAAAVVGAPWKLGPGIHVIGAENLQAAAAA